MSTFFMFIDTSSETDGFLCESPFFEPPDADRYTFEVSDGLTTCFQHSITRSRSEDVKAKTRLETGRHPTRKYDKVVRAAPLVSVMLSCEGQFDDFKFPARWHNAKLITFCM